MRVAAPGVKVAARRRVRRVGHLAGQLDRTRAHARVGLGDRGHQRLGVRMLGLKVQLVRRRHLDQETDVHHRHPVADVFDHAQVVGDEQVGQVKVSLQVLEQVQHLCLDRYVERGNRLVADDQLGVQGQGAGDADALALPAAKGVRVARHVLPAHPHQLQQLADPVPQVLPRQHLVDLERLGDDALQRHPRVQRGERVLEDDLHLGADELHLLVVQLIDAHRAQVWIVERDLSAGRLKQAQDRAAGGRLAAAAFAHQSQGLALLDVKADPVHRLDMADHFSHQAAVDGKVLFQVLDLEQDVVSFHIGHDPPPSLVQVAAHVMPGSDRGDFRHVPITDPL